MKLVYKESGVAVKKGETLTDFRGNTAIVTGWQEPKHEGSSGRVCVKRPNCADFEDEYFPSVFGCKFVEE